MLNTKNLCVIAVATLLQLLSVVAQSGRPPTGSVTVNSNGVIVAPIGFIASNSLATTSITNGILNNIPLSGLGQSGAMDGQVPTWTNGAWTPASIVSGASGSMSFQNSNNVNIIGGSISISNLVIEESGMQVVQSGVQSINISSKNFNPSVLLDGNDTSILFSRSGVTNFTLSALGGDPSVVFGGRPSVTFASAGITNFFLKTDAFAGASMGVLGNRPTFVMGNAFDTNFSVTVTAPNSTANMYLNGDNPTVVVSTYSATNFFMVGSFVNGASAVFGRSSPSVYFINSGTTNFYISSASGNVSIFANGSGGTNFYANGTVTYGHSGIQTNNGYDLLNKASADVLYAPIGGGGGLSPTNSIFTNNITPVLVTEGTNVFWATSPQFYNGQPLWGYLGL